MAEPRYAGALWRAVQRVAAERPTFGRTWEAIRSAGLPVRRAAFVEVWRAANEMRRASESLRGAPRSHVPTPGEVVQSPLTYGREFAYRVRVTVLDPLGRQIDQVVTVTTDSLLPLADVIDTALDPDFLEGTLPGMEPADATVLTVERSS